jgi:predicted nucleic acid-binding protein
VTEFLAVTKGVLCNRRNAPITTSDMAKVKTQLEQFLSQMGIILYDGDEISAKNKLFSDCELIIENSGSFKGRYDHKWHHLKGADALHVALALSVKAEVIATFDDDFRNTNVSINSMMLSEMY